MGGPTFKEDSSLNIQKLLIGWGILFALLAIVGFATDLPFAFAFAVIALFSWGYAYKHTGTRTVHFDWDRYKIVVTELEWQNKRVRTYDMTGFKHAKIKYKKKGRRSGQRTLRLKWHESQKQSGVKIGLYTSQDWGRERLVSEINEYFNNHPSKRFYSIPVKVPKHSHGKYGNQGGVQQPLMQPMQPMMGQPLQPNGNVVYVRCPQDGLLFTLPMGTPHGQCANCRNIIAVADNMVPPPAPMGQPVVQPMQPMQPLQPMNQQQQYQDPPMAYPAAVPPPHYEEAQPIPGQMQQKQV